MGTNLVDNDFEHLAETKLAEHFVLYQYRLVNARNHYMGLIQTESVSLYFSLVQRLVTSPLCSPTSNRLPWRQVLSRLVVTTKTRRSRRTSSRHGVSRLRSQTKSLYSVRPLLSVITLVLNRSNNAGAGLYSFFDNYSQVCIPNRNCQTKIMDVDSESKISVFSLSTVASVFQVGMDGNGIVDQSKNVNGFASTVTLWRGGCKLI